MELKYQPSGRPKTCKPYVPACTLEKVKVPSFFIVANEPALSGQSMACSSPRSTFDPGVAITRPERSTPPLRCICIPVTFSPATSSACCADKFFPSCAEVADAVYEPGSTPLISNLPCASVTPVVLRSEKELPSSWE